MNTNKTIDVADFLRHRLEAEQVLPPASVWDNVQHQIPTYLEISSLKWKGFSLSIITVLIVASFILIILNTNKYSTNKALSGVVNKEAIQSVRTVKVISGQAIQQSKQQISHQKEQLSIQTEQNKNATIFLDASLYQTIVNVQLVDTNKNVIKTIVNPSKNEFGYYVIDVSGIAHGNYMLIIKDMQGNEYKRKEVIH